MGLTIHKAAVLPRHMSKSINAVHLAAMGSRLSPVLFFEDLEIRVGSRVNNSNQEGALYNPLSCFLARHCHSACWITWLAVMHRGVFDSGNNSNIRDIRLYDELR